jgi:hypothetical protein
VLPLDGSRQPFSYLQSDYNETGAQFSPDGSWVVYTSNESGKREVYIQSFPKPGNKRRISTAGGVQPRWRGDGREIFYIDLAGALISVELTADLEPLLPKTLFDAGVDSRQFHEYAVTFDGQKFLLNKALHSDAQPINVIVNWTVRAPE